jgi:dihydrolipoamide dehydrogenase
MQQFDLLILGGGPAGYLAAERAGAGSLSVALFEKRSLGGVCLNEGCIPTKARLYSSKLYDSVLHGKAYGLKVEGAELLHSDVLARKNKVVKTLVAGVSAQMKAHHVTVIPENAVITGKTVTGFSVHAGQEDYEAKRLLIATGSQAIVPPIPGVKEGIASGSVLTSREILDLSEVPETLVIVGGGVIGLEMACYFQIAGAKVTVVEMLEKIAGPMEAEISKGLLGNLQKKGIEFKLGCKVTAVSENGVSVESKDGTQVIPAQKVLLCIGRRPFCDGVGLETIGVHVERGAVVTDEHLRTSIPNVYAAGDVNGKVMLAHTAYREAEVAVNHMLGKYDRMQYDTIPSVIYSSPEAAGVGETEESAIAKGFDIKAIKLSMRYAGRYIAENDGGDGICKLIFDKGSTRLLGVHMIGSYSSEIILSAAMMVDSRKPLSLLKEIVFPHPTVGEILREGLFEIQI